MMAAALARFLRRIGVILSKLLGEAKTVLLLTAFLVLLVAFARKVDYSFAVNISSVEPTNEPTTEDLARAALPAYMQPSGPAAPPSALDVLGQAAAGTDHGRRAEIAAAFAKAVGLMKQTRIGSVNELDYFLKTNLPPDVQQSGFMRAWQNLTNELLDSGQLHDDPVDLTEYAEGTEQLLRGGP